MRDLIVIALCALLIGCMTARRRTMIDRPLFEPYQHAACVVGFHDWRGAIDMDGGSQRCHYCGRERELP